MKSVELGRCELLACANSEELAALAAGDWLRAVSGAGGDVRAFCTALSGGRTAQALFKAIRKQVERERISMAHVHFFWADERCVPPDHAESNYAVADAFLLQPLRIPAENIHRLAGELPPDEAARRASAELCRVAPSNPAGMPVLDVVFLGVGEDGHVASLFPAHHTSSASSAVFHAVFDSPKPPPQRLTLSYRSIAAAREVWLLVSGSAKQAILRQSLQAHSQTPLARVVQSRKVTRILTDFPVADPLPANPPTNRAA